MGSIETVVDIDATNHFKMQEVCNGTKRVNAWSTPGTAAWDFRSEFARFRGFGPESKRQNTV